jgi:hypothetical protein
MADDEECQLTMTTMITELYDALKDAGASEDKARKAAETVAAYENRFAKIETDLAVLKWMVGTNLVLTLAVIASTASIWLRVGEISGQLTALARLIH